MKQFVQLTSANSKYGNKMQIRGVVGERERGSWVWLMRLKVGLEKKKGREVVSCFHKKDRSSQNEAFQDVPRM